MKNFIFISLVFKPFLYAPFVCIQKKTKEKKNETKKINHDWIIIHTDKRSKNQENWRSN